MGKLFECLLEKRLRTAIEEKGGISTSQYGFRKKKSTIDALSRVVEITEKGRNASYRNKKLSLMIVFDVKNAFNTVQWRRIIKALEELKIPTELVDMIKSYLEDRILLVGEEERRIEIKMGVPQGSVLGPLLWNVFYDNVLKLEMPEGIELIAYADDLAMIVVGRNKEDLQVTANEGIIRIKKWMEDNGLELAAEKTEMVILAGRRKMKTMTLKVGEIDIEAKKAIKYLGVWLDKDLRMTEHVRKTVEKTEKAIQSLNRIMPSEGAPSSEKRKILASVASSILLYGAPIWTTALQYRKYREMTIRCQRRMALRVVSAYRTVSTEALLVIAAIPPMDMQADERKQIYKQGQERKTELRKELMVRWQQRWEGSSKGAWTKRLVPKIEEWVEKGAKHVEHYTAQFLTGHGSFRSYLKRIGKTTNSECQYCRSKEEDTAEHVLSCERWKEQLRILQEELGGKLTADNFNRWVAEGKWETIQKTVEKIMRTKTKEEYLGKDETK